MLYHATQSKDIQSKNKKDTIMKYLQYIIHVLQNITANTKATQLYCKFFLSIGGAVAFAYMLTTIVQAQESQSQESQNIDVDEIVALVDNNRIVRDGLTGKGTMRITDRYGTRESTFDYVSKGADYSLITFTNANQLGQKVLRRKDKIYLYYPDAEDVITLNKSMFQQSFMDSDLSFEDIAGDKTLTEAYSAQYEGTEVKDGYESYVVYLSAYNPRQESYPYQRLWVEVNTGLVVYAELFTRRQKLLKTLAVHDYIPLNDIYVGTDTVFKDVLKKDSSTQFLLTDVSIVDVSVAQFSLEELRF